jgi:hypothetical protein
MFKTGFWVQNHLWICVLVLWIHKGYFIVKKRVWKVRIKDFWYTKWCILYKFNNKIKYPGILEIQDWLILSDKVYRH